MIKERVVFETQDGKQFASMFEAEEYQFKKDLTDALHEGSYEGEFHVDDAIEALLATFTVVRK